MSIRQLKEKLSDVSTLFEDFSEKVVCFEKEDRISFSKLSKKLFKKKFLASYIRKLQFITRLSRYLRKELEKKRKVLIDDLVHYLLNCFPELKKTLTEIRKERKAKRKRKPALDHKETAHASPVARTTHKCGPIGSGETTKRKPKKKNKSAHATRESENTASRKQSSYVIEYIPPLDLNDPGPAPLPPSEAKKSEQWGPTSQGYVPVAETEWMVSRELFIIRLF